MAGRTRRTTVLIGLTAVALALTACSAKSPAKENASVSKLPQRILRAPGSLVSVTGPAANGTMWMLAGKSSKGLFEMDSSSGGMKGSISVSADARSVAETPSGIIAVALGGKRTGALELLSSAGKLVKTIALPAPALQVVVGSDGTTFYVLTATDTTASVAVVGSAPATSWAASRCRPTPSPWPPTLARPPCTSWNATGW